MARGGTAGVGIELAASPPSSPKGSSVIIGGVVAGSPAEKAGVKTGDQLTAVDGEEVLGGDSRGDEAVGAPLPESLDAISCPCDAADRLPV